MPEDDAVAAARDRLYAVAPDEFMPLRTELVKAARADGDADAAKEIGALRKPTAPASVVNRYAHADPEAIQRLTELGDRLRQATAKLDAKQLRELSTERRERVAETTRAAFEFVEVTDPPAAQRDEVSATFDAAVADPGTAERIGHLVRPEKFSGFGIAPGPDLTLVQGGKIAAKQTKPTKKTAATKKAAPDRRLARAATKARNAYETADEQWHAAGQAEQRAKQRVATLTDELAELQKDLDAAKRELDDARKTSRQAKTARRTAQSALDKAERELEG